MAHLRPRARIIRTIGDQLISGPEAALIELVKNAYDADSPTVRIAIQPRLSSENNAGQIVVEDLGHGMSRDQILENWLEPATDEKFHRRKSPNGRWMLGAKGIGRFASSRLGQHLYMLSTAKVEDAIDLSFVDINWTIFDRTKYLDQVEIDIQSERHEAGSLPTGVRMEIRDLKDDWTRKKLEKLIRELRRLVSPTENTESGFSIRLDLSAISPPKFDFNAQDLVAGVAFDAFENSDPTLIQPFQFVQFFDYQLLGQFDAEGAFTGTFMVGKGDAVPEAITIAASAFKEEESPCGVFSIRVNIYDRERASVEQLFRRMGQEGVGILQARQILNENSGVGIYREGFRIRPYGDPDSDWLELERLRVQNPSLKLGMNQVSGIVSVQDPSLSGLIERSSREGFENSGSFTRLKRLVGDVIAVAEQKRFSFRQKAGISRKTPGDLEAVKVTATLSRVSKAITELPKQYREAVEKAAEKDSAELQSEIEGFEQYKQILESRAALGLVVAEVLHEGRRHLSDITTRSKMLVDGCPWQSEDTLRGQLFRQQLPVNASSINTAALNIARLFRMLDPISGRRRGRPKAFSARSVVERCLELLKEPIRKAGILLDVPAPAASCKSAYGYEDDLQAALLNVIDNAIHWLSVSASKDRYLHIITSCTGRQVRIAISNNGPPIDDDFSDRIFDAGFTIKSEGTGLGLSIAREALRRSKGELEYDRLADETTFNIVLPVEP